MPHQCTTCGHSFEDGSKEMLDGCPDCGGNTFQFYPSGTDAPEDPPSDADDSPEPPEPSEAPESSVATTVGRATTKVRDFVSSDPPDSEPAEAVADAPWPDDEASSVSGRASDDDEVPPVSGGASDIIDADARATEEALEDAEDAAQASARTEVVSDAEIEAGSPDDVEAGGDDASPGATTPEAVQPAADDDAGGTGDDQGGPAAGSSGSLADAEGRVVSEPSGEEPDIQELREQLNAQFESIKILEPGQYELNLMELYDREEYIIALQENGRYVIQVPEQWMGDRMEE
jgi:predicted  nucleic acid-binding Zn-ribbon protein